MKRKALILAAKPEAFEGPEIHLEEGRWKVETSADFDGCAVVDVTGHEVCRHLLQGQEVIIEGPCSAQAVLLDAIADLGLRQITVQVCRVG